MLSNNNNNLRGSTSSGGGSIFEQDPFSEYYDQISILKVEDLMRQREKMLEKRHN
jgi:hypothetical protein